VLTGDGKLVERCLQGDDAAWEAIVTTYARRIYNLGYRYTGRTDEAEDLTQEIFIKIYQNLKAFRPEAGNLLNWILKVSRNLIIDHYRQTRRFQHTAGSEEMETMNLSDEKLPDAHRLMEQSEASRFLRDGLQALSPELKEAVILRDLEGMAYQEIAQLLNVPEGTVKSRIRVGLKRLRTSLQASGVTLGDH